MLETVTHELGTGVLVCTFSETIDSTPATLQLDTAAAYFKNDDNDDVVMRLDGAVVTEQDLLTLTLQVISCDDDVWCTRCTREALSSTAVPPQLSKYRRVLSMEPFQVARAFMMVDV